MAQKEGKPLADKVGKLKEQLKKARTKGGEKAAADSGVRAARKRLKRAERKARFQAPRLSCSSQPSKRAP